MGVSLVDNLNIDLASSCFKCNLEDVIAISGELTFDYFDNILVDSEDSAMKNIFTIDLALKTNQTLHDVCAFGDEQLGRTLDRGQDIAHGFDCLALNVDFLRSIAADHADDAGKSRHERTVEPAEIVDLSDRSNAF